MSTFSPDLTVVVNVHAEGLLAHRTLCSLRRALDPLHEQGLAFETIAVLDRPDIHTRKYFARCSLVERTIEVDFGDLAEARNAGTRLARGRYLAFLDADDLVSRNWLSVGLAALAVNPERSIVHPEYTVRFGGSAQVLVWQKAAQDAPDFQHEGLLWANPWDAACMALRDLFLRHPYQPASVASGWGCEDHHWHAETIAAGCTHILALQTVLFVRRKAHGSLLQQHLAAENVVRPNRGFDFSFLSSRIHSFEKSKTPKPSRRPCLCRTFPASLRFLERFPLGTRIMRRLRNYRLKQAEALSLLFAPIRTPVQMDQLPATVRDEWRALNLLDPAIFPDPAAGFIRGTKQPWHAQATQAYMNLVRDCGNGVTHLFLVPRLVCGGVDQTILNYAQALARLAPSSRIVIVATEDHESPWKDRLPHGVSFVDFGCRDLDLSLEIRAKILLRMLLQTAPERIHVVNSRLGYDLIIRHGQALKQTSQLYASVYPEILPDGRRVGYAFEQLPDCFDHLHAISTDNQTFIDQLCRQFGFDPARCHAHYQPVIIPKEMPKRSRREGPLNVLWAGRLDRQKRIDLLAQIAHACEGLAVHFHVYGTPLLDPDPAVQRLRVARNVSMHGSYDGFAALPFGHFDAFLYTSQYDGIPNVILEAMAACLPVVASDVGGIREVVRSGETGWLVSPPEDIEEYVRALSAILEAPAVASSLVVAASQQLEVRHSLDAFSRALKAFPGYTSQSPDETLGSR